MPISPGISDFLRRCCRKPPETEADTVKTSSKSCGDMARCLTTGDLISLGVGSITGANVFIIPNRIASLGGGAGVVSLALTTVVSLTTGLHYAELATTLPNTSGSICTYVYFTLGEAMAVIAGWSLLGQYLVGGCFALIGFSAVVDSMADGRIHEFGRQATDSMGLPPIDFVAALVCILLTVIIASGVEMSVGFVKIMNVITVAVLVFFFSASLWLGTPQHWEDTGFVPYGVNGIVATIPMSYYAIVGFDGLTTAGDECKTPNKSIPIALFATIIGGGFLLTALPVLFITFLLPLDKIPEANGILEVFSPLGYPSAKYVLGIGAVTSLLTTIFGGLYPTTRVAYAIAKERFIFKYFEKICPKRHTPFRATIVCGVVATLMSAFLDLSVLLGFGVLSALVCYVLVVAATLTTRYQAREKQQLQYTALMKTPPSPSPSSSSPVSERGSSAISRTFGRTVSSYFNFNDPVLDSDDVTSCFWMRSNFRQLQILSFTYFKTFLLVVHLFIVLCCVLVALWHHQRFIDVPCIVLVIFGFAAMGVLILLVTMLSLPESPKPKESFRSSLIPYISLATSTINIYFMTLFDATAWLFYSAWIALGLLVYVCYGCYLSRPQQHHPLYGAVEREEVIGMMMDEHSQENETVH